MPKRLEHLSRLLLLVGLLLAAPAAAQDPVPADATIGRVEGQVINLTAGTAEGSVGVPVVLYVLENFEPTDTYTSTVGADGAFVFSDVPLVEGRTYITTLEYQKVAYGSTFLEYEGVGDVIQLDIETYEVTTDPAVIRVGRLHVIVDFAGETMRISELYIFDNNGDRVYAGATGDPTEGTLELPLPVGALRPQVQRSMGESMVPTTSSVFATDGGYLDTLPVRPGQATQQLMVVYELPYSEELTVSHMLPYATSSVSLFLPDAGLEVESDMLTSMGPQALQGMAFLEWEAKELAAGTTLAFTVKGEVDMAQMVEQMEDPARPQSSGQFPLAVGAGDNITSWLLGVAGLALAAGLVAFFWFRRGAGPERSPRESLLQAIAELDAAHEAGEIPAVRYEFERERLKDQLRDWYR